ncbi:MAG: DUF2283 domain-containing protein [Methylobacteriaceae bacterium]|nr:DUF2283 domain-containing protein [Methylobacteriaceae bacterium]
MRMKYDQEADALYVRFSEEQIDGSEEVRPGVILDYDNKGRIVGIEVLDARKQMTPDALLGLQAAE